MSQLINAIDVLLDFTGKEDVGTTDAVEVAEFDALSQEVFVLTIKQVYMLLYQDRTTWSAPNSKTPMRNQGILRSWV
jgi:hypothetical protein